MLIGMSGTAGFAASHPIQRAWRDIHFAAMHVALNPEQNFAHFGRSELGDSARSASAVLLIYGRRATSREPRKEPRSIGEDLPMKFYDCTTAPSPRRVRIFLAEKGITVPTVQVDLRNNRATDAGISRHQSGRDRAGARTR